MSVLIAVPVYDTVENKRSDYTGRTLMSLLNTVDFTKNKLGISDNGSCRATHNLYEAFIDQWNSLGLPKQNLYIHYNNRNIGTAAAVNEIWKYKKEGEHCCKMDNDVVIHDKWWLDKIEMVFEKDPLIGICALKRMDLEEHPDNEHPFYKSEIKMLPHTKGEPYLVVEYVQHAFGTVQVYSSDFLKNYGYMYQFSEYSLDDAIAGHRAKVLGYKSAFLPHIDISHIDIGGDDYTIWKQKHAGEMMQNYYSQYVDGLYSGDISPYYDGGFIK